RGAVLGSADRDGQGTSVAHRRRRVVTQPRFVFCSQPLCAGHLVDICLTSRASLTALLKTASLSLSTQTTARTACLKWRAGAQPLEARSRPCGTAPPVQGKRGLPGLLHGDFLSPRAHERGGPRIARIALERIALEEGTAATDTDCLLGDRDH